LNRVVNFLGANRTMVSLSESEVLRFTMARRAGDKSLEKVVPGSAVSNRKVELELILLMSALNWGARERNSTGRRLLRENPLHGIKRPKEKNPRRPVMRHDVHLKLVEVAGQVHPLLKLALVVAEGAGRRISGWMKRARRAHTTSPGPSVRQMDDFATSARFTLSNVAANQATTANCEKEWCQDEEVLIGYWSCASS
jgi:hypothetical protein